MVKTRHKKRYHIIFFIFASSIIFLNCIGISYAVWSDRIEVRNTVNTGNIKPRFCGNYSVEIKNEKGDSKEGEIVISFSDDYTVMNISGTMEKGDNIVINYGIKNDGTIPIILENKKNDMQDEIKLKNYIIYPGECINSDKIHRKLIINSSDIEKDDPKNKNKSIDISDMLIFRQWNY